MGSELPKGWRIVAVQEAIDFREGPGILARDFAEQGVPLIRLAGLTGASLLTGCNFLDPEKVGRKWSHFRLAVGDTLLSTSASLGRIARVDGSAAGAIPYTGIIRMRPNGAAVLSDYLPYVLADPAFERQVKAMGAGSVMQHFGPSHLRRMTLRVPPAKEQEAIVQVLGAIGEKLQNGRRLIATLKDVRGLHHQDFARGVPDDVVSLGSLSDELRRGIAPRYLDAETGVLVLNQRCVRAHEVQFGAARRHDETKRSVHGREIRVGDILVNSTGVGTLGRVAAVEWLPEGRVVVDSHVTVVRPNPEAVAPWWLVSELLSREEEIVALGEGSTGQTELSRKRLAALPVRLPTFDRQQAHAALAKTIARQRGALMRESRSLTAIRDALLPKLVSGQIRVPFSNDPEEQVGAAIEALT